MKCANLVNFRQNRAPRNVKALITQIEYRLIPERDLDSSQMVELSGPCLLLLPAL